MKNIHLYADHIDRTIIRYATQPQDQMKRFLRLLDAEGLDTSRPILYGYDSVRRFFWFRNDVRGELISLPLHEAKVWPEQVPLSVMPF